ncbi:MAG: hypothetical protein AB8F65_09975 [Woeseiaceae bacterium]
MSSATIPAKYQAIAQQIQAGLVKELRAAEQTQSRELLAQYHDLAEDYQTLSLMGHLPKHAKLALNAYQSVDVNANDADARRSLLVLLRDCYRDAITQYGEAKP